MDTLFQDTRYAARKLLRTPGFTFVAVATLALAIAAVTAVFSIVNGVLLMPLPFRSPSELVKLGSFGKDGKLTDMSPPDFIDFRDQNRSFAAVAPIEAGNSENLSVNGSDPARLSSANVGAQFFDVLGVSMQLGRGFIAGEDSGAAEKVAVLSDRLWRNRFGADDHIIGRAISLNGNSYTVVGVAPASLTYPGHPDIWMPFVFESWMTAPDNRGAHFISAVARLRPGVSLEAGQSDMRAIGERLRREYPKTNTSFGGSAQSLAESITGSVRGALLIMFGAVTLVLLIACANVANLLLVRAAGREAEMAVRTALGAGRGRIIRQLVTESLLLSLVGALIGGALAAWIIDAIVAYGPKDLPRVENVVLDTRVLAFSVAVAMVTGVLFGLVPAVHAAKSELAQVLKEGSRGASAHRSTQRTRSALVVGEMALAVILLVGAGLLIQSFVNILHVDPGFRSDHVMTFNVSLPGEKYPFDRDVRGFARRVQNALVSIPGAESVAIAYSRPMEDHWMRTGFDIEGRPRAAPGKRMVADLRGATSNFYNTIGIRLIRGRLPTVAEDDFGPPPVAVVTEAFAKKFFPNEDPIGQTIVFGFSHDTSRTANSNVTAGGRIVGIINDVHQATLDQDAFPAAYLGWGTLGLNDIAFVIRSHGDIQAVSAAIRDRVRSVDATMPVYDLRTMQDVVSDSVAEPRFYTVLLASFAALALLLAALGVYGVISYSVSQRTRELGIRVALGASHERVVRLIVGRGVWLAVGGVGVGLVGAYSLVHVLSAMLYDVSATNSATFIGVGTLLLGVAWLASYLPARRAANVDPVVAMRAE